MQAAVRLLLMFMLCLGAPLGLLHRPGSHTGTTVLSLPLPMTRRTRLSITNRVSVLSASGKAKAKLGSTGVRYEDRDSNVMQSICSKVTRPPPKINSLWQRLLFNWVRPLIMVGNRRNLELEDLWGLTPQHLTGVAIRRFERAFAGECAAQRALSTGSTNITASVSSPSGTALVASASLGNLSKHSGSSSSSSSSSSNAMRNSSMGIHRVQGGEAGGSSLSKKSWRRNVLTEFWASPLTRTIFKLYRASFIKTGILKLATTVVQFSPSLIVMSILRCIERAMHASTPAAVATARAEAVVRAGLLFVTLALKTLLENQYYDMSFAMGTHIRSVLSAAIYRKSLQISNVGDGHTRLSEAVNIMQLDTHRLEHVAVNIHTVWNGSLQLVGYTILLLSFLGSSVLAGVAIMLLLVPLNSFFLHRLAALHAANLRFTDTRVKLISEILNGIFVIKSHNWTFPFAQRLKGVRQQEVHAMRSAAFVKALLVAIMSTAPNLIAVLTLGIYALTGNTLTPAKVFTALALFNQLKFPLVFMPILMSTLAEGKASLARVTRFLMAEELKPYVQRRLPSFPAATGRGSFEQLANVDTGTEKTGEAVVVEEEVGENEEEEEEEEEEGRRGGERVLRSGNGHGNMSVSSLGSGLDETLLSKEEGAAIAPPFAICVEDSSFSWTTRGNASLLAQRDESISGKQASRKAVPSLPTTRAQRLYISNFTVVPGELIAVVGATGGGKTSLLQSLLGELIPSPKYSAAATTALGNPSPRAMPRHAGVSVCVLGSVAYAAQNAWIPHAATFREAVLFGRPYDEKRYQAVLASCGLLRDLASMEDGDMTEIRDKGTNLSGGQKQRLALARALYEDADIYLLDDSLSALDNNVADIVFTEAILGFLKGKTRILVTHNIGFLPEVDRIVVMGQEPTKPIGIGDREDEQALPCSTDSHSIQLPGNASSTASTVSATTAIAATEQPSGQGEVVHCIMDQGTLSELHSRGHDFNVFRPRSRHPQEQMNVEGTPPATTVVPPSSIPGAPATTGAMTPEERIGSATQHSNFTTGGTDSTVPSSSLPFSSGSHTLDHTSNWKELTAKRSHDLQERPHRRATPNLDTTVSTLSMDSATNSLPSARKPQVGRGRAKPSHGSQVGTALLERLPTWLLPRRERRIQTQTKVEMHTRPGGETTTPHSESPSSAPKVPYMDDLGAVRTGNEASHSLSAGVSRKYYYKYLLAARSNTLLAAISVAFLAASASHFAQQHVMALWTSDADYTRHALPTYLGAVATFALAVATFNCLRSYLLARLGAASSWQLHSDMAVRVMDAPLSFLDNIPMGRLLNRFSKDLDFVDQQLPPSLGQLVSCSLQIISAMVTICSVTPSFSFVVLGIFWVYSKVIQYYRSAARSFKRLEFLSRSPTYSHFSETLAGLQTIRAFRRQGVWCASNEALLDDSGAASRARKVTDRWLCVHLEFLGNIVVMAAALLAVFTSSKAGAAGLSINNALAVTGLLNWAVRNLADTEALMNSVERVVDTAELTPAEQGPPSFLRLGSNKTMVPATPAELNVPPDWPRTGVVQFSNVYLRYTPPNLEPLPAAVTAAVDRVDSSFLPPAVLRNISFSIPHGQRVVVVGRTGSGKSSLLRALLRVTNVESGSVRLDGVDLAQVPLGRLRESIAIIPQDAMLFSGTIRFNLDPFGTHSDGELWSALQKARLFDYVAQLPAGLEHQLVEGGSNLSAGHRQLLCLARALVRKSKLLLLDEATSSVDRRTDAVVQRSIQREFGARSKHVLAQAQAQAQASLSGGNDHLQPSVHSSTGTAAPATANLDVDGVLDIEDVENDATPAEDEHAGATVLSVAHRLDSIKEADIVIVMEKGQISELGPPSELLGNKTSILTQLLAMEQCSAAEDIDGVSSAKAAGGPDPGVIG